MPIEYAAVWEVTKRGRLHLNLVMTGWRYIPQKILASRWNRFGGGRVSWIENVHPSLPGEVAKPNRELAAYLGKLEQIVLTGRAVNFSRRWPKLPKPTDIPRQGRIHWHISSHEDPDFIVFAGQLTLGYWLTTEQQNEWKLPVEPCNCFVPLTIPAESSAPVAPRAVQLTLSLT